LIGLLILWSSWDILKESVSVLLEHIPKGLDMRKVEQTIDQVQGVLAVHDLHVWTIGSGILACSCHILVAEQSIQRGEQVVRALKHRLDHDFKITHTTIQVEVEGCEEDDMYCVMKAASARHAHDHKH
jgi:cobalt-zinc-cadmium efflux system protein